MLVELLEEYVLPRGYRATVCRFASRFFVLVGHCSNPPASRQVEGPYDTDEQATRFARGLQRLGYVGEEMSA